MPKLYVTPSKRLQVNTSKMSLHHFFEELLYAPKYYHYPIIVSLFPIALLYAFLMLLRRILTPAKAFDLPIISVGNLMVGGSGKTPFILSVASRYKNVAIISRGYGRASRGMVEVSHWGRVLVDVNQSGDEAMLLAQNLPHASVIVSEKRGIAIERAKALGAKILFLDDGFNRVEIKKFEILLEPQKIYNPLPLPSGAFRELYWSRYFANTILKEGREFKRMVAYENLTFKMLLVTAISNPSRLEPYLPNGVIGRYILADHAYFDLLEIKAKMEEIGATSILVTQKDFVKLSTFDQPISLMKLQLQIDEEALKPMEKYIQSYEPTALHS